MHATTLLRASFVMAWLECPRRAREEPDVSEAQARRGTLGHEVMRHIALGSPDPWLPFTLPFLEGADEQPEHNSVGPDDMLTLKQEIRAFLAKHEMPDESDILGVEWNFREYRLHRNSDWLWRGTVDLVYLDHMGRLVVRDYKFGWGEYSAAVSLQLRVYAAAAYQRFYKQILDHSEIIIEYAKMRTQWVDQHHIVVPDLLEYLGALDDNCARLDASMWSPPLESINKNCSNCRLATDCATLKSIELPETAVDVKKLSDVELADWFKHWAGVSNGAEALRKAAGRELTARYFKSKGTRKRMGTVTMVDKKNKKWPAQEVISHLVSNYSVQELIDNKLLTVGAKAAGALAKKDPKLAALVKEIPAPYPRVINK